MELRRFMILIAAALSACAAVARADDAAPFAKANSDYAAGRFDDAVRGYDEVVRAGNWSATLFYDLANAYFRAGNSGKAILNYERALALEAKHPEAAANLRLARERVRALELRSGNADRYLRSATSAQYAVTAAAAFWIAAFAGASLFFRRRRTAVGPLVLVCGIAVCGLTAYAAWALETGNNGRALAIVTAKDIQARLATADNSGAVLALPPGSEVKVLSTRGDWIYAALPNDLRGWIPATAAELVRM